MNVKCIRRTEVGVQCDQRDTFFSTMRIVLPEGAVYALEVERSASFTISMPLTGIGNGEVLLIEVPRANFEKTDGEPKRGYTRRTR